MADIPFDPRALDDEATKPVDLSLAERIKANKSGTKERVTPVIEPPKRGPGRPPGSRNATKTEPKKDNALIKKAKVKEYQEKIVHDLNDNLMLLLIGQGLPPSALYKDGKAPVKEIPDSNYTEFGARIAIPPGTAKAVATFITELEFTDTGTKFADTASNGTVGLVVKGLIAAFLSFQYAKGLMNIYEEFKPFMEANKQYQAQQAAQAKDNQ